MFPSSEQIRNAWDDIMGKDMRTVVQAGQLDNDRETAVSGQISTTMLNALETIRSNRIAKRFEIGEVLFAQFDCPAMEEPLGIWAETDHLVHVLTSKSTWKTSTGTCSAEAGQTMFFKKGVYILPEHSGEDVCVELFFIPDSFVRETVMELAADLPVVSESVDLREPAIQVNNDVALSAFFHAMTVYFAGDEKPPEALLRLKLKELLTSILVGQSNLALSAYFRSLAACEAPPIAAIMEMNFYHNLSLDAFAQMCHRSLSSFKREFRKHYGTSPGRWLLERRLERSASLLQTTGMSVTEIMFECGFEDLSHFSRTFKEKFGRSPNAYRRARSVTA
jgi:AraC family transcriptional regulator, exoenzyme S synthesis regulatory protein ExsA